MWARLLWLASLVGLPAALALAAGALTRVAAWVSYACAVAVFGFTTRSLECAYQADGFLVFGCFFAVICPMERALSVDRLLGRVRGERTLSNLYSVMIVVMLAATYLDTFTWKIGTAPWRSGLGIWVPASQPFATWFDLGWLSGRKWLIVPLGYLVLAFQASFPLLIWVRRARLPLALMGAGMHISIAVLFPIPLFGLVMAVLYLPLLSEGRAAAPAPPARAVRIAIIAWVLAWPLINIQSALYRSWFSNDSLVWRASRRFQRVTCALVGMCRHPIFLPGPFAGHTPEYRLAYSSTDGVRSIPLTTEMGTMGTYGFNRNWCVYSLYLHRPSAAEMRPGLDRFVRFWAARNQVDLSLGEVLLYQREPNVDFSAWQPNVLATNRQRPWSLAARLSYDSK
jgi:hypothetical protein